MLKAVICRDFWSAGSGNSDAVLLCKAQFQLVDDLLTITTDEIEQLENDVGQYERHQAD